MANTTIKIKDEKVTKGNVTVYRNGRFRLVYLNSPTSSLVVTLDEQDRPSSIVRVLSKVYNGTTYVDCYISVDTNGQVAIKDYYGGDVPDARYGFLIDRTIVYFV